MTNTYIEVVETKTSKVIHRVYITGSSSFAISRIESGMNINLNHEKFHTRIVTSDEPLFVGNLEKEGI